MQSFDSFHIPKPCHENWDSMNPAERGRHCAVCDKVVQNFVGMEREAIFAEIRQHTGGMCGRFDRAMVLEAPLKAETWMRFPVERLRVFVLAFVMVFGLEVWGISQAQAQTVQPAVDKLKQTENLQAAVQESSNEIHIRGKVVDVYTREPVEFAHVMVLQDGVLLKGTLSNAEGQFEVKIAKDAMKGDTFDLHLSYLGKTRKDVQIQKDVKEFLYLIDASQMLEGVAILGNEDDFDYGHIMGVIIADSYIRSVPSGYFANNKVLYRPLDEWLMMNFSEIHHSGRW